MKPTIVALLACIVMLHKMPAAEPQQDGQQSQTAQRVRAAEFLALLHKLQYVESAEDVAKLIPHCPKPVDDVGDQNTEIKVTTTIFGYPAEGEFHFHKDLLVSHGFQLHTPDYKSAHDVYLKCSSILNEQVRGLRLLGELPFGLDGKDGSDGPQDQITLSLQGVHDNASIELRLEMRSKSIKVGWGAQKASAEMKKRFEQTNAETPQEDLSMIPWPKSVCDFPSGDKVTFTANAFQISRRIPADPKMQSNSGSGGPMVEFHLQDPKGSWSATFIEQSVGERLLEPYRGKPQIEIWGRGGSGTWSRSLHRYISGEYRCVRTDEFEERPSHNNEKALTAEMPAARRGKGDQQSEKLYFVETRQ